jgi:integrase
MAAKKVPSYRLHKPSGQARVIINGRHHYLGVYGSGESKSKYARLISEQAAPDNTNTQYGSEQFSDLTIDELLIQYLDFAKEYYVLQDGRSSRELTSMKEAMRHIRELFGSDLAGEFGPKKLKAIREHMINVHDLSRGVINNRVNRMKRIFRWAVSEELIPTKVYEGLRTVPGLRKGRTKARETNPVKPVCDEQVQAVLPFVSSPVRTMIQLQRLTGMRPCEVVLIRKCDIDMSGEIWIYTPMEHKNSWRGHERNIPLGPKSQNLLQTFLDQELGAYLFSPKQAERERNLHKRQQRKTPMTPSQKKRKRKKHPRKSAGDHYDTASYRRAIKYGIAQLNKQLAREGKTPIPDWYPLQLRHSRATELNEMFGIEAAAVSLGHAHAEVTKVYAERNLKLAIKVAKQVG